MRNIVSTFLLLVVLSLTSTTLKADEGMWLLPYLEKLNIKAMKKQGFKLSAKDIYDVNKSSLKDAVVIFGGFCTGEIVSNQGLLLTNHHCSQDIVQRLSTEANNYLRDGFWAMSREQEIPVKGLSVSVLVRMEDITERAKEELKTIGMRKLQAKLEKEYLEQGYDVSLNSFFQGEQYLLSVYQTFNDVRLVGIPPESIGYFGGDFDNWEWPRHTGDFSMYRIYADKDNKPAEYSAANKPYTPKKYLTISLTGVKENDYAMVIGMPGRTSRYLSSFELDELTNVNNAVIANVRKAKQDVWNEAMIASEGIRLKYSYKYFNSTNGWKNATAQVEMMPKSDAMSTKQALEAQFEEWVKQNPERVEAYGNVIKTIKNSLEQRRNDEYAQRYMGEAFLVSTEMYRVCRRANNIETALGQNDSAKLAERVSGFKSGLPSFFKDYDAATDQKVMEVMLKKLYHELDAKYHPEIFATIKNEFGNDFAAYTKYVYENTVFCNMDKLIGMLENLTVDKITNDPAYILVSSINSKHTEIRKEAGKYDADLDAAIKSYRIGMREMQSDKVSYPDANATIRLTYGNVKGYSPRDGITYSYRTTFDGLFEKENPKVYEYTVPAKLKDLHKSKDYGKYAENGQIYPCFLSTNDITGGNSGSPVLNSKGELIGIAFDGTWDGLIGDSFYVADKNRCVNVDIRYVLFVVDKFAGAGYLLNEMTIVK